MLTQIDKKQIKDFYSLTGTYYPTGWSISGDVYFSGTVSGISGDFQSFTVGDLSVTGALNSPYLSGIIGTTVTGSGIVEFLSTIDTSGNNIHFVHSIHTGDRNYPLQSFSSQDDQAGWFYYNDGSWSSFPALGLNSTLQNSSIVRHLFHPTGMDVFTQYFNEFRLIYAGNVTGGYANSSQFQSPTEGFTVRHIPFLAEYFATADSKYVIKEQKGSEYVPSGIVVSGVELVALQYGSVPAANHGLGTLIQVGDVLYNYTSTGYQLVAPFTGVLISSGGYVSGTSAIFSGQGQVQARIVGANIIAISGGGVNQFAVSGNPLVQGNIIFSGRGNKFVDSVTRTSGTVISYSGGMDAVAVPSGLFRQGQAIFSGYGGHQPSNIVCPSGSIIAYSGGVDAFALSSGKFRQGNLIFSGEGGVEIREELRTSGAMYIFSGGAGGGGGGIGNVTGIGVDDVVMYTGAFIVSGSGTNTVYKTDVNGMNAIVISGEPQTLNYNTYYLSGSNEGIISAGLITGSEFVGTLGMSGVGGVNVTLSTEPNAQGFSGLFKVELDILQIQMFL